MRWILLTCLIALWTGTAHAHKPSDSLLRLQPTDTLVEGQWDIALRDLDHAIVLDTDGDGSITWGELRRRHDAIATYALTRLEVRSEPGSCKLSAREQLIDRHSDGSYAVLRFVADCGVRPDTLTILYRLFFDLDPQHRGVLRIGDTGQVVLFSAETTEQRIRFATPTASFWRDGFASTLRPELLLFLSILLIPAWRSRAAGAASFKTVAAFMLASSLALSLTALHSVSLPGRLVDVARILSLFVAALSFFSPLVAARGWLLGFGVGLLHGVDLATAFIDGAIPAPTASDVLVFNAGIGSGEMAIALCVVALLEGSRRFVAATRSLRHPGESRDPGYWPPRPHPAISPAARASLPHRRTG